MVPLFSGKPRLISRLILMYGYLDYVRLQRALTLLLCGKRQRDCLSPESRSFYGPLTQSTFPSLNFDALGASAVL